MRILRTTRTPAAAVVLLTAVVLAVGACGSPEAGSGDDPTGGSAPASQDTSSAGTPSSAPETSTRTAAAGGETTAGAEGSRDARTQATEPVEVETRTIATGLEVPWGIAFLPDGDALFTERDSGRLLRMDGSGDMRVVQTLPTQGYGEGGSLGLAVSPDYRQDGYVYAYYTTGEDNRVARFRLGEEPEPILTGIPFNTYHDGGRIAFGPDGMLYVATGDAGDPSNSQDRDSLGGKILRLNPDGSVPDDNPFPGSPVYSWGHRNVEGLAWDAEGRLYASEFGQDTSDEANRIEAGENYGWPDYEGEGGQAAVDQGYVNPITTWSTDEASPSGAEIPIDGAIPQWEGDLFVAALRGERLWRLELDEGGNVVERERLLDGEYGRIRNVVQAPDGSLWVTTSNLDGYGSPFSRGDRILRLAPENA